MKGVSANLSIRNDVEFSMDSLRNESVQASLINNSRLNVSLLVNVITRKTVRSRILHGRVCPRIDP